LTPTSAEIVELVAEAMESAGRTASHIDRVMRALKDSNDPAIMPKSKKGGGKGMVYPRPSHFANFALGIMATNTATEAALAVQRYRPLEALMMEKKKSIIHDGDNIVLIKTFVSILKETENVDGKLIYPWEEGRRFDIFGEIIKDIILNPDILNLVHECRVWHAEPWAEITFNLGPGERETYAFAPIRDLFDAANQRPLRQPPSGSSFSMPVKAFEVLGQLARYGTAGQENAPDMAREQAA
jgi:hypothetical protein